MKEKARMLKTGVCSVTLRPYSVGEVVDLTRKAGLDAIEWGGDVHVPPGNKEIARTARRTTEDAGLSVSSYGSYYKILDENGDAQDFSPVLDSALELGTDTIRIWAGGEGSDVISGDRRKRLADQTVRVAEQAAAADVRIAFEFHNRSLTDTNESAYDLLEQIGCENVFTYWQPMYWGPDLPYRLAGLEQLKEKVLNFHVFYWLYDSTKERWIDAVNRRSLEEGGNDWEKYLSVPLPEKERFALLEFVRDDCPEQFLEDARTLKRWVGRE